MISAADGAAGIARARTLNPDLILLDIQLPTMPIDPDTFVGQVESFVAGKE